MPHSGLKETKADSSVISKAFISFQAASFALGQTFCVRMGRKEIAVDLMSVYFLLVDSEGFPQHPGPPCGKIR